MSAAELNKIKSDLIDWISKLSDESTIAFLEGFKQSHSTSDWWETLPEHQRFLIQRGLKDAESNKMVSSSEFWKQVRNER
jgi:hypothetical protein